jgi:hypothetical protein
MDLLALAQRTRWDGVAAARHVKDAIGDGVLIVAALSGNPAAFLGAALLQQLSDQPDLREWEMLPRTAHVLPLRVPPGRHLVQVGIRTDDAGGCKVIEQWADVPDAGDAMLYFPLAERGPSQRRYVEPPPSVTYAYGPPMPVHVVHDRPKNRNDDGNNGNGNKRGRDQRKPDEAARAFGPREARLARQLLEGRAAAGRFAATTGRGEMFVQAARAVPRSASAREAPAAGLPASAAQKSAGARAAKSGGKSAAARGNPAPRAGAAPKTRSPPAARPHGGGGGNKGGAKGGGGGGGHNGGGGGHHAAGGHGGGGGGGGGGHRNK